MKVKTAILITALALAYAVNCKSQCLNINLIKNPSLEEYNCCPINLTMINCADYWTQPLIFSTSDYFNTCAIDSLVYPPSEPWYLHSFFGQGYAGLNCYAHYNAGDYREYLQGELVDPLVEDQCYHVEFWTLLFAYSSNTAIDALGVFFSDSLPKGETDADPFYFAPQINNYVIVTDTINWTKISGDYLAQGGEKYFTVGTFKQEGEINKYKFKPDIGDNSYYFFDNFSLCPCEDTIPPDTVKPVNPVLEVYPNPANENLFILFNGYDQLQAIDLEIYNVLGELVMNEQIISSDAPTSINIAPIASGCYAIVLKNGSSILYKDKLIIIK